MPEVSKTEKILVASSVHVKAVGGSPKIQGSQNMLLVPINKILA